MKKHLLKNLDRVQKLFNGKTVSLFLDYDGTLTPIVGRPQDARLSFEMKGLLKTLSRRFPSAIVSGRGLEDVRSMVGIKDLVYAGNHGMEIWGPRFTMVFDPGKTISDEMNRARGMFMKLAAEFRGVTVENKGLTLSIHFRLLDNRDHDIFTGRFDELSAELATSGLVRFTKSKKAFEVRPNVLWHKGKGVEWILERRSFSDTLPVYIGDDETDKDGFRAVVGRGISVFVGGDIKEADFYLNAQDEVKVFLKWLCGHPMPRGGASSLY